MARTPNAVPPQPAVNGHDPAEVIVEDGDTANSADLPLGEEVETQEKVALDPGISDLQKQLDEERQRREAAEREAADLRSARQNDQREVADHRLLVIDSTITTKETEKKAILQRLREAKEAGDYEAELAATDELSTINIDLKQAKIGKSRLETEIEDTKAAPQDGDRLEQYIRDSNMHPKSAAWLRDHRDYATDPVKNAELVLAHQKALRAGVALNSPEYFEAIEASLGMGSEQEVEEERQVAQPQRRQTAPVAPPSRGGGVGGAGREVAPGITQTGNGKFRVTPQVAEAAAISGIPLTEYVQEAIKLKRGSDGQLH